MIIRALRLRHGRLALPRAITPFQPQRRQHSSLEASDSGRVDPPAFIDVKSSTAQEQLDALSSVRSVELNDPNHPVAQDYAFFQHQKARTQYFGSTLAPHYKPHTLINDPPSPKDITLELLLASQAHIGHATSLWHPANARYIFGVRGRKKVGESPIHIISLEATAAHLRRACKIVTGVTERGGLVLFVGTREGQARAVVKAAQLSKGCHLFTKWIPGSITNGQQILGRCAKKVVDEFDEEIEGFENQLATKAVLKPDLVVCLNPLENYVLLHECGLNNIPTIGIIDTDANPTWVTYPIPANDDSLRSVQVIAGVLGRAGEQGQVNRQRMAKEGTILYSASHGLTAPAATETSSRKRSSRQPQPEKQRPTMPGAITAPMLDLPGDLEGQEVKQYVEDQRLLEEAEKVIGQQVDASNWTVATDDLPNDDAKPSLSLSTAEDAEADNYQASELDPSLIYDSYFGPADDMSEEDAGELGGTEQLQATSTIDQAQDLQKELGEDPEGSSPMDQVEGVAKELGEESGSGASVGNSDVTDADPQEGAKYEAPVRNVSKEEKEERGKEQS